MTMTTTSFDLGTPVVAPAGTDSATRRGWRRVDGWLLAALGGLLLFGLVINYTASYTIGNKWFDDGSYYLKRQLIWMVVGLGAGAIMYAIDYRVWRRFSVLVILGTLAMLMGVLVFGVTRLGGERWLLTGGSVQPSELAKLTVVIYIADWLASKKDDIRDVTLGLIPFSIMMGIICGLIVLEHSFSIALLVGLVAVVMFFTAGAELTQMLMAGAVASVVFVGLILQAPYRMDRVRSFMDPSADPSGHGYQVIQSLSAIGEGGVFGVGLGSGQQKALVPLAHTDNVFAVVAEELGLAGCLLVLALFSVIVWRGFRIAAGAPTPYASLLAAGITCWITGQALINIGVVTHLIPATGVTLPFVSYGGSSLVTSLAAMGLLLNISGRVDPAKAKIYGALDLRRGDRRSRLSRTHRARRVGL